MCVYIEFDIYITLCFDVEPHCYFMMYMLNSNIIMSIAYLSPLSVFHLRLVIVLK